MLRESNLDLNNVRLSPVKFHSNFLFPDENECATGNNNCEQMCRDTEGSYYCECHKGYRVGADRITCEGKRKPLYSRAPFVK